MKWSKSYNCAVRKHKFNRADEEEQEALVTPQQVSIFESSSVSRNAIMLFGEYSSDSPPILTQTDYCCKRDYLITEINLQNKHRSGVSSNMTLEEFRDDMYRIKIKKHKTAYMYGHAKVYLKKHVFRYLSVFVENVRNQIVGNSTHIFVSFNGLQMGSGSISKQLNENWRRAGVYGNSDAPTRNVSTTILRKSSTTAVLEHHPEVSKDVADLLLHSENTQKKYYDVRRREISSARGAKHVGNLLRFGSIYPENECPPSVFATPKDIQHNYLPHRKWN